MDVICSRIFRWNGIESNLDCVRFEVQRNSLFVAKHTNSLLSSYSAVGDRKWTKWQLKMLQYKQKE